MYNHDFVIAQQINMLLLSRALRSASSGLQSLVDPLAILPRRLRLAQGHQVHRLQQRAPHQRLLNRIPAQTVLNLTNRLY
jgi:hypothetical protein